LSLVLIVTKEHRTRTGIGGLVGVRIGWFVRLEKEKNEVKQVKEKKTSGARGSFHFTSFSSLFLRSFFLFLFVLSFRSYSLFKETRKHKGEKGTRSE